MVAAFCPFRDSCAGRKQGTRRKKDRRKWGKEWQKKKKSTKQALDTAKPRMY